MLTRTGRALAGGGAAFALAGILFGNWPFFGAGALLLVMVSFGALAPAPRVSLTVDRARFTFEMRVELARGAGVVEVHQPLPEEFELVEGTNFHVLTVGLKPRTERFTFVARAPKRGEFVLPPRRVRVMHPLAFSTTRVEPQGESLALRVEPRPIAARVPRGLRTRARRPFPDGDVARMGVATNEFRELREYVPGDPPRRINWKATARRIESGASEVPLVNETEWEGKKCVYVLVDGHARLNVGTNLEDAREHAADAALSLLETYERRGHQVALALARSGRVPLLGMNAGAAQVKRARDVLSRLRAAEGPGLMDTLQRDAALLHRTRPLVVLVTRLGGHDPDVEAAIRRVGALALQHGRRIVPGLVVDVRPAAPLGDDAPARVARQATENDRLALHARARAAGLRVTEWRAGSEPLESVLARGRLA